MRAYRENPESGESAARPPDRAAVGRDRRLASAVPSSAARTWGVPMPGTSSALDYFDTLRQPALPANLIQAQRDYFGAHTYQRSDREGVFHTPWHGDEQPAEPVPFKP